MQLASLAASDGKVTVNDFSDMSLDESGSNFAIVAATSLLLDVTRGSSDAYRNIGVREKGGNASNILCSRR